MGGRLYAVVVKELWAILRDPRARIILVVPPLFQLFVFGFASTLEVRNFDIGVYNRDGGASSREFIERLGGSPNVGRIVPIGSPGEARDAIDGRSVIAVVTFDQEFSANVAARRAAVIQAVFDGRRSNAAQIVSGYLERIAADMGADIAAKPTGVSAPPRSQSIVANWFNSNLDYLWFTMPGLVVVISMVSGLAVTAQSVARERELGTFDQLMVSPLRVYEILAGKMVPPLLVGVVNATVYVLLIPTVFGVPLTGSLPLFYCALVFYLLALIGVGILVSVLSQTQQQAFLGAFLVMVPAILLSGYASPVDNMPGWLQVVAQGNPARHFLVVSEGVFLKAMPAAGILANTWPLMVIAAVTLGASTVLFRSRME
ncbi:MAG TPA: ABC transporter permease [Steroidobacteraceae bacterium]|nr:ABC transporter permease [Steroidobacteraceae bacterium]